MSYYQSIANNQHEMLQNMANDAVTVENANIEALNEYDKKQKDLSDTITNLQGKLKTESGRKEVVDGVPISEDDIAELVGGKASINLVRNTYHSYINNLADAQKSANPILSGDAFLSQSRAVMEGTNAEQAVSKIQKTKIMGQSILDGFKSSTTKTVAEQGLKDAVTKATQEAQQAGKTGEELAEVGKTAKAEFLKGGFGGVLGKIGAGVSVADGLSLANQDIQGLRQGKGWDALGDNFEERASNITGMVGDALSLFPPTEILGGILDVASGAFDYFGEKKEDLANQAKLDAAKKTQDKSKPPPPIPMTVHPTQSAIGMVSNISHPITDMIQGSGAF